MTRLALARGGRLLAAAPLLALATAASAATINVPADYTSIQAAVDAAAEGDEIVVGPGTYGPVFILFKTITIRSSAGPQVTFIDCGGSTTTGVYSNGAYGGPNYPVTLDGFTITQCGNGFHTHYSGGNVVRNCVITGNNGSGIYVSAYAEVTVEHTRISDNHTGGNGGGISGYSVTMSVNDSVIERNSADGNGGGVAGQGFCATYSLNRTVIRDNVALGREDGTGGFTDGHGGGIYVDNTTSCAPILNVNSSLVSGNQARVGGAASVIGGTILVRGSTFTGNQAPEAGSINAGPAGGINITDSIIYFNSSPPILPAGTASHSDIEGDYSGEGVIHVDPLFVDAAAGNYALREDSPCRDVAGGAINFDILDACRPLGPGYDMGAYEFVPAGSDADGDGYLVCADCNDSNGAIHPGAAEVCNGADDNCDGRVDEGFDGDGDGFTTCAGDCNDADVGINPGAAEIIRDGVDQDCTGYDLTIIVKKAEWKAKQRTLYVEASSLLGARAALVLPDYRVAMTWDRRSSLWIARIEGVAANPGAVSVAGPEGLVTATVITK